MFPDGLDVKDYGDIETGGTADTVNVENMNNLQLVSVCNKNLSQRVSQVLQDGRVAVTIGGDHSIGVGKLLYLKCLYDVRYHNKHSVSLCLTKYRVGTYQQINIPKY